MTDFDTATLLRARMPMVALGAGSGLAFWLLARTWGPSDLPDLLYLAMFVCLSSFCGGALAMVGPLSLARALGGALWIALPLTALMLLASQRFVLATDLLENEALVLSGFVLVAIACPFVLLRLSNPGRWTQFADLSAASWGIVIRLFCGVAFVVVFWILGFLSNALLDLVNITILEQIADVDWLAMTLSGAAFGLGLAVVQELGGGVAPHLLFRLLSLLLLPVLLVVGLFLTAIPVQGLSSAFGQLSSAATLMTMAGVMMTLVCVVLIRHAQPRGLSGTTARLLAVGLMLVTGLAVWAVAMRILQYGWTPDRVYAASLAGILLFHGLVYAGCALFGGTAWADVLRRAVVGLGFATGAMCALMLTPVIDAGRISANSQLDRVLSADAEVAELPLWHMAHRWGQAGRDGMARLEAYADTTGDSDLQNRLRIARTAQTQWAATQDSAQIVADLSTELRELLPVRPLGVDIPADLFSGLKRYQLVRWIQGCKRLLPDGRPGCVLIKGPLGPSGATGGGADGHMILLFREGHEGERLERSVLRITAEGTQVQGSVVMGQDSVLPGQAVALLTIAQDEGFELSPARQITLKLGELEILILP